MTYPTSNQISRHNLALNMDAFLRQQPNDIKKINHSNLNEITSDVLLSTFEQSNNNFKELVYNKKIIYLIQSAKNSSFPSEITKMILNIFRNLAYSDLISIRTSLRSYVTFLKREKDRYHKPTEKIQESTENFSKRIIQRPFSHKSCSLKIDRSHPDLR